MKNFIFGLLLFSVLATTSSLSAQTELTTKHGISARVLLIDYARASDADREFDFTSGGEVAYIRKLSKNLNFVLPLKAGIARYIDDINNTSILGADAALQFQFLSDASVIVPYVFGGGGIVLEDFDESNVQFPVGGGLNFKVGKTSFVSLQGEYRFSNAERRNNLQLGVGYVYKIGPAYADRDKDRVPDEEDACPDAAGLPENMGCPDTDGDGIVDKADLCPNEVGIEKFSGCPDTDGDGVADRDDKCPGVVGTPRTEGCPDQDEDGFADRLDECPNEAGTIKGCPDTDEDGIIDKIDKCPLRAGPKDNDGCPKADEDGDGVADENDECPGEMGTIATRGCPDADGDGVADKYDKCPNQAGKFAGCPDTDGDGVDDYQDKCPNQAGPATNSGCPELKKEERETLELAMRAVQFDLGRATLLPSSYNVLDRIADIMNRYPGYSLSIEGHTDNTGSASTNERLSQNRALACYNYLRDRGISTSRMSYNGYGETRPIADNDTRDGRAINRRTEFNLFIR